MSPTVPMAKKHLKQPKRPNMANCVETTPTITSSTVPTTATCDVFRELIEEADIEAIKEHIPAAGIMFDREIIESLWDKAYQVGRLAMLKNLDIKLEKEYEDGYEKGKEECKGRYFVMGIEDGREKERAEWVEQGHSYRCFMPIAILEDTGTQTNPQSTTTSIATQTNTVTFAATSQAREFVENGVGTHLAPSVAVSTQTTPITTTTVSSSVQTNPSTLVATSQHPELPGNQKNTKIHSTSAISPNLAVFSPQTPSVCVLDPAEHSTIATALKMCSTMAYSQKTTKKSKICHFSLFPPKQPHKPLLLASLDPQTT
jgi:hypothetical protein